MAGGDWLGLSGRVCVVTGAGGGIGSAIAASFAAAGAHVALLDKNTETCRQTADALAAKGSKAIALACDTADPASVEAAAAAVTTALGPCDVLANNAGFLSPGALASLPLEAWNANIAVNLTGYFICAQVFGRAMLERKCGALVHIASIAATNPQPWSGAYSVTKAGVAMLSRQLAAEWGSQGVRSNAVSPGLIRTPMSEAFYQHEETAHRRAELVPAGRVGTPQDIADAVVWLASDRAAYVSGEEVIVDGGVTQTLMGLIPRPGFTQAATR
ncbi:SDR family oxidoreductase [Vineibacter terrae]|uniref:SDR family oxidoreductase n=1 Tax=Vineibacter terrae TaxID=2586908 RepID=A0A5C8PNM4_9HYPH|nr:SDR family oxidoreductase [Vineibacter terrae]TXL75915.1 SDR family oxidoreductase [Vineibacter terrae]